MALELTDENFDEELKKAEKPILVDFWAPWCQPCFVLAPILEKVAEEFKEKVIFAKANLEFASVVAQKIGINVIPTVVIFNGEKPVSGFVGARPEPAVRDLLNKMLEDINNKGNGENKGNEASKGNEANIEEIIRSYQEYAEENGFRLNPDRGAVERLVKGLLENEKKYGARYCPCRRVAGNPEEDKGKICPCQWHREEIERDGHCFCGLFWKK